MVAYDAEFIAINWANYLNFHLKTSWPIYSDCQSAVDTIKYTLKHHKGTYSKDISHHLQNIIRYGLANNAQLIWIEGHTEKHKAKFKKWNVHDYGNYLADLNATGKWKKFDNNSGDMIVVHLRYHKIMLDILPEGEWVILGPKLTPLGFKQTASNIHNELHTQYLHKRDRYRANRLL
jgi:hypothetical protein